MLLKRGLAKLGLVVCLVAALTIGLAMHEVRVFADDGTVAGVAVGEHAGVSGAALAVGGSLVLGSVIAKGIDFARTLLPDDTTLSRRQNIALVFAVTAVIVGFVAFSTRNYDVSLIIVTIFQQAILAIGTFGAASAVKAGGTAPKPSA